MVYFFKLLFGWRVVSLALTPHLPISIHILLLLYVKLFNFIFNRGIVPEIWSVGIINPVFKNKGNANEPKNYRAITLMSCFGKVFTGILNSRLTLYAEETEQNFRYCLASGVMEKILEKKP